MSLLSLAACAFSQTPAPPAQGAAPALPDGLYAIFNTDKGVITAQLFEKETPATVAHFVGLAKGTKAWLDPKTKAMVRRPMFNNILFYRVMLDGMIQAGDVTGKGSTPCGVHVKDEIVPSLKFDKPGKLAMANRGEKNTAECEWFITQASPIPAVRRQLHHLRPGGGGTGCGEGDLARGGGPNHRQKPGQTDHCHDQTGGAAAGSGNAREEDRARGEENNRAREEVDPVYAWATGAGALAAAAAPAFAGAAAGLAPASISRRIMNTR